MQYADGSIEDICLRGLSVLPEGGTSAAVLKHIESRIFSHSRRLLTEWKAEYERENSQGSWAAAGYPSPDNIGLHRLAEDTVLSTDTCNGARCTRRLLAEATLTHKRSERCTNILPAGALLWAWEADAEFDEKAGEQWMVLHPDKYNKQVQYAWRVGDLIHASLWPQGSESHRRERLLWRMQ